MNLPVTILNEPLGNTGALDITEDTTSNSLPKKNNKYYSLTNYVMIIFTFFSFSFNIVVNPFPHTAILQQTTFRKILNVLSDERNENFLSWKALKTLWQMKKLLLHCQMFSNVVCCSRG